MTGRAMLTSWYREEAEYIDRRRKRVWGVVLMHSAFLVLNLAAGLWTVWGVDTPTGVADWSRTFNLVVVAAFATSVGHWATVYRGLGRTRALLAERIGRGGHQED